MKRFYTTIISGQCKIHREQQRPAGSGDHSGHPLATVQPNPLNRHVQVAGTSVLRGRQSTSFTGLFETTSRPLMLISQDQKECYV